MCQNNSDSIVPVFYAGHYESESYIGFEWRMNVIFLIIFLECNAFFIIKKSWLSNVVTYILVKPNFIHLFTNVEANNGKHALCSCQIFFRFAENHKLLQNFHKSVMAKLDNAPHSLIDNQSWSIALNSIQKN